jgi:hypothetical protein
MAPLSLAGLDQRPALDEPAEHPRRGSGVDVEK